MVEFLGRVPVLVIPGGRWGDYHHGGMGHVCRSDAVGQVEHTRTVGGKAHAGRTGDSAETIRHEGRTLLVADSYELQIVAVIKRVEDV